jgi:hypothetical protein
MWACIYPEVCIKVFSVSVFLQIIVGVLKQRVLEY